MRTLDFTPSDSGCPNQTAASTPLGALVVLPEQLRLRTPSPKGVEGLIRLYQNKDGG